MKEEVRTGGGGAGEGRQEKVRVRFHHHAANLCDDGFEFAMALGSPESPRCCISGVMEWFQTPSLQTPRHPDPSQNQRPSPPRNARNASFGSCRATLHGLPHEDRNAEKLSTFFFCFFFWPPSLALV
jgi:hypothetical protein